MPYPRARDVPTWIRDRARLAAQNSAASSRRPAIRALSVVTTGLLGNHDPEHDLGTLQVRHGLVDACALAWHRDHRRRSGPEPGFQPLERRVGVIARELFVATLCDHAGPLREMQV